MQLSEYVSHDAVGLAELVRTRQVRPGELLDLSFKLLELLNWQVNAVVVDTATLAARDAENLRPGAPFGGVPFLLKDALPLAGFPMTEGSHFQSAFIPRHDSELVRRFRAAGFLTIGKTNTPEFGLLPTTEPALHGATRNPWALARTAGGSSGGSAAAVAARIVPAAHGSDGAGSIRIPASCCGVFGLKPTRGRITASPDYGALWGGLGVDGVLTRSVRDSAAILDAVAGGAPGDPFVVPIPARPFLSEVNVNPGRLRIAVVSQSPAGTPVDAECLTAVTRAAELLKLLGHIVEEATLPVDPDIAATFVTAYACLAAFSRDEAVRRVGRSPVPGDLELFTAALSAVGEWNSAPQYIAACEGQHRLARAMAPLFMRYDMILTPTLGQVPPTLGAFQPDPASPLELLNRMTAFAPFAAIANMIGHPAMSVPLHWTTQDVPIGVQFIGDFAKEHVLLRLGAQLEQANPWASRIPPIVSGIVGTPVPMEAATVATQSFKARGSRIAGAKAPRYE